MIHKIIYLFGATARNTGLFSTYRFLKHTENWCISDLRELQLKKLKRLIGDAYSNTVYYRRLLDEAGLKPGDIASLDDLERIPTLDKKTIRNRRKDLRNQSIKKLYFAETSGSTGEPLCFYKNLEWDNGTRAAQLRGYSWYNIKPWERNGYLWGYANSAKGKIKTAISDQLMNRFRLFSYQEDEIARFAKKLEHASYLEGYSSMIYEIAREINRTEQGPYRMQMVKGTSEKIYDAYQNEVRKAFGTKMISEYGAAETGLIAFECPSGKMHVAMENVIVEEVDGEAVVTNLNSFSMPIIRYRLGDYIELDHTADCTCGMQHMILQDVLGRVGKTIYGANGMYPSLTFYYVFKNYALETGEMLNYQVMQDTKGELLVLLEERHSEAHLTKLREQFFKYFRDDMTIQIKQGVVRQDYNGKYLDFISNLAVGSENGRNE